MIIETYIIDYLQKKTGVSCYAQYDDASQDTFIVVEKTGGYTDNFIRHATLAIQSYGSSLYDAAVLNEKVKEAMDNAANAQESLQADITVITTIPIQVQSITDTRQYMTWFFNYKEEKIWQM